MTDTFFEALDAIVYLTDHAGVNVDDAIDLQGLKARLAALAGETPEGEADEADAQPEVAEKPTAKAPKAKAKPKAKAAEPVAEEPEAHDAEDEEIADEDEHDVATEVAARAGVTQADAATSGHARTVQKDGELKSKAAQTIRIRTSQVDELLNVIIEVVISQIKADQRVHDIRGIQSHTNDAWQAWVRVKSALASLGSLELVEAMSDDINSLDSLLSESRREVTTFLKDYADDSSRTTVVVGELQELGMGLRMLPANTIFQAFPRAVRDLAKQFKKEIDFVIEGGATELDKKVLEEINDPLVHIMRNAVDHGIEDTATRIAAGKPAAGTILLAARQEGDRILIEISDDGAGIDPEKIRESAIRKGYITEAEAKSISDREAQYLIF